MYRVRLSTLSIALTILALPAVASAEQEDDPAEEEVADQELPAATETVTTTARAPMPKFAADRSVDVVDEEDIVERQAHNLSEAIQEESGVYRQSTNRGADTVYMRGLIGPENMILVDGVRFNQATFRTGPNQYLATLDPWAISRVEAVRGPGSVLYGSGAMGGVLQLFPRPLPDEDGWSGRALGAYASADHTLGAAFDAGARQGDFATNLGFSFRNHQSLRTGTRGNDSLFMSAEQDGQMLGSEYRQVFWRASAGAELSDDLDLRIHYMGGQIDDARRTDQLGRGQMRSADNRDDMAWARLTYRNLAFVDELTVLAAYHHTDELTRRYECEFADDAGRPTPEQLNSCASLRTRALTTRRDLRDTVHTAGAGVSAVSYLAIPLRLSYGAEFYRDHVGSTRQDGVGPDFDMVSADRGNFADGSRYATMGGYVHGEYSLWYSGDHEVLLNGGARVEHFRAFAPQVTEELGDVDFQNTGLVGALGASYLLGANLNLYLNWNQGFRAPNLQEATVLGDTGNFFEVPNPDLGPEQNDTFELGLRLDLSSIGQLSTSLFTSLIRDRITRGDAEFDGQSEIDGKPVQQRINADLAYFYGAEAGFRSANHFGFELFANLAWIDGAVQSDQEDPNFEAGPLHGLLAGDVNWTNPRRLPPLQFLAGLTYRPDPAWSATFFVEGAGPQTKLASGDLNDLRICERDIGILYDAGQCPGTPGWATLNLRGTYRIDDLLHLNLAVTNLTDQRYQHHGSGVFGAGLQGMATLVMRR